jgi:hypothetical protein
MEVSGQLHAPGLFTLEEITSATDWIGGWDPMFLHFKKENYLITSIILMLCMQKFVNASIKDSRFCDVFIPGKNISEWKQINV